LARSSSSELLFLFHLRCSRKPPSNDIYCGLLVDMPGVAKLSFIENPFSTVLSSLRVRVYVLHRTLNRFLHSALCTNSGGFP
jgi:hypothetical protein